jgi:uncharacterized protein DUF6064
MATGHRYPEMPMFGVTPCPVTIFTFGLLLLTVRPVPRSLFVIPFVWSAVAPPFSYRCRKTGFFSQAVASLYR